VERFFNFRFRSSLYADFFYFEANPSKIAEFSLSIGLKWGWNLGIWVKMALMSCEV